MDVTTDPGDVDTRPAVPDTIAKAVRLMLVGAALGLVLGVIGAFNEIHRPAAVAVSVASSVVVSGIWWLVARACQRGRRGGRTVASVFFGLSTLGLVQTFSGEFYVYPPSFVVDVLSWLVGLGAIILLWHRDSGDFFHAGRDRV